MITRLDHAVIAVRNLDEAIGHYRSLGFDVSPGGHHTGQATHNAIVRFGLDYLELLSIYDASEAAGLPQWGQLPCNACDRMSIYFPGVYWELGVDPGVSPGLFSFSGMYQMTSAC